MKEFVSTFFKPLLSSSLPLPSNWEVTFESLEFITMLIAILIGIRIVKLKKRWIFYTVTAVLLLFIGLFSITILLDDYFVLYKGQSFSENSSIDKSEDEILVTLPIFRQETLVDFYPEGKNYEETPGSQALEIFENKEYRWYVSTTKVLYLISFLLITFSRALLLTLLVLKLFTIDDFKSFIKKLISRE